MNSFRTQRLVSYLRKRSGKCKFKNIHRSCIRVEKRRCIKTKTRTRFQLSYNLER